MRTEDLKLLFKDVSFKPDDIKSYIIDLLSKFEVALMWDERNLLIPSLLPTEQDLRLGLPQTDIRVSGCGGEGWGWSGRRGAGGVWWGGGVLGWSGVGLVGELMGGGVLEWGTIWLGGG